MTRAVAAVALFALAFLSDPARAAGKLPFIEDDFGRAVRLAQERELPLFVESWAPW